MPYVQRVLDVCIGDALGVIKVLGDVIDLSGCKPKGNYKIIK